MKPYYIFLTNAEETVNGETPRFYVSDRRDISTTLNWPFVGEVELELPALSLLTESAVKMLELEERTVRAEREAELNTIQERRQKLLAIPSMGDYPV